VDEGGAGDRNEPKPSDEIARLAETGAQDPFREFLHLVARTRKYWMIPIVLLLLLAGAIVMVGGSSLAPLIYTLF
jgi:hypothetical protein